MFPFRTEQASVPPIGVNVKVHRHGDRVDLRLVGLDVRRSSSSGSRSPRSSGCSACTARSPTAGQGEVEIVADLLTDAGPAAGAITTLAMVSVEVDAGWRDVRRYIGRKQPPSISAAGRGERRARAAEHAVRRRHSRSSAARRRSCAASCRRARAAPPRGPARRASISACDASRATVNSARFLPFTWTGRVMCPRAAARSASGQAASATRPVLAERRPAFLGQVRHHRARSAAPGSRPASRSGPGRGPPPSPRARSADRGAEGVGQLVDMGDAAVEAQPLDILLDARRARDARPCGAPAPASPMRAGMRRAGARRARRSRRPAARRAGRSGRRPARPPRSRSRRARAASRTA